MRLSRNLVLATLTGIDDRRSNVAQSVPWHAWIDSAGRMNQPASLDLPSRKGLGAPPGWGPTTNLCAPRSDFRLAVVGL